MQRKINWVNAIVDHPLSELPSINSSTLEPFDAQKFTTAFNEAVNQKEQQKKKQEISQHGSSYSSQYGPSRVLSSERANGQLYFYPFIFTGQGVFSVESKKEWFSTSKEVKFNAENIYLRSRSLGPYLLSCSSVIPKVEELEPYEVCVFEKEVENEKEKKLFYIVYGDPTHYPYPTIEICPGYYYPGFMDNFDLQKLSDNDLEHYSSGYFFKQKIQSASRQANNKRYLNTKEDIAVRNFGLGHLSWYWLFINVVQRTIDLKAGEKVTADIPLFITTSPTLSQSFKKDLQGLYDRPLEEQKKIAGRLAHDLSRTPFAQPNFPFYYIDKFIFNYLYALEKRISQTINEMPHYTNQDVEIIKEKINQVLLAFSSIQSKSFKTYLEEMKGRLFGQLELKSKAEAQNTQPEIVKLIYNLQLNLNTTPPQVHSFFKEPVNFSGSILSYLNNKPDAAIEKICKKSLDLMYVDRNKLLAQIPDLTNLDALYTWIDVSFSISQLKQIMKNDNQETILNHLNRFLRNREIQNKIFVQYHQNKNHIDDLCQIISSKIPNQSEVESKVEQNEIGLGVLINLLRWIFTLPRHPAFESQCYQLVSALSQIPELFEPDPHDLKNALKQFINRDYGVLLDKLSSLDEENCKSYIVVSYYFENIAEQRKRYSYLNLELCHIGEVISILPNLDPCPHEVASFLIDSIGSIYGALQKPWKETFENKHHLEDDNFQLSKDGEEFKKLLSDLLQIAPERKKQSLEKVFSLYSLRNAQQKPINFVCILKDIQNHLLQYFAITNNKEGITQFLQTYPHLVTALPAALKLVASTQNEDMFDFILKLMPDLRDPNIFKHALQEAVSTDNLAITKKCIKLLEDTAELNKFKEILNGAFVNACASGRLDLIKTLLNFEFADHTFIDPSFNEDYGLYVAASSGYSQVVEYLLTLNNVNPISKNSRALAVACAKGHSEVVSTLIADPRIDPSQPVGESNKTPLQIAKETTYYTYSLNSILLYHPLIRYSAEAQGRYTLTEEQKTFKTKGLHYSKSTTGNTVFISGFKSRREAREFILASEISIPEVFDVNFNGNLSRIDVYRFPTISIRLVPKTYDNLIAKHPDAALPIFNTLGFAPPSQNGNFDHSTITCIGQLENYILKVSGEKDNLQKYQDIQAAEKMIFFLEGKTVTFSPTDYDRLVGFYNSRLRAIVESCPKALTEISKYAPPSLTEAVSNYFKF